MARTADGHSVVVAGTDFDQVQKLDQLVVGNGLAEGCRAMPGRRSRRWQSSVSPASRLSSIFRARTIHLNPVGTLQTGAAEDSRIYISLADFTDWTHLPYSTIEISALGLAARNKRHHAEARASSSRR